MSTFCTAGAGQGREQEEGAHSELCSHTRFSACSVSRLLSHWSDLVNKTLGACRLSLNHPSPSPAAFSSSFSVTFLQVWPVRAKLIIYATVTWAVGSECPEF